MGGEFRLVKGKESKSPAEAVKVPAVRDTERDHFPGRHFSGLTIRVNPLIVSNPRHAVLDSFPTGASGNFIAMNSEFIAMLDYLEREKGIKRDTLIEAISSALVAASKKSFSCSRDVRLSLIHISEPTRPY